jgi:hypothetical protein
VGIYGALGSGNDLNSGTIAAFSSLNVPATSQVVTANSSPGGDFLTLFGFEFSGVGAGSVSVMLSTASSSSTTVGSIVGSPVVVPTGSMLFALCFDTTNAIGHSPVLDNGSSVYTNFFDALGVTFAGSGSSVTPLFTPYAATATNYSIIQFLLNLPVSTGAVGIRNSRRARTNIYVPYPR